MHRRFFGRCIARHPREKTLVPIQLERDQDADRICINYGLHRLLSVPSVNPFAVELVARAFSRHVRNVRITRRQMYILPNKRSRRKIAILGVEL